MKNYKNISKIKLFIIKSTLFLGQKTLIGRGLVRKKLINFINYLIQRGTYKESRFIYL
jgi:hypothetical protein